MPGLFSKILSMGSDKELKEFQKVADRVNALAPTYAAMSDAEIAAMTPKFKERHANGESLDDLLPDAFAAVREMSERTIGMRHFDVQVIGAIALHRGMIAEMKTGEGKTLVSTLAGYLNALDGQGVHIVTVNDYLAKRDSEWMGRLYRAMGMNVGLLQNGMPLAAKHPAYDADVTYGTNSEFGFDYLRDNMVTQASRRVQRGHHYAIVDEVDSILIDEARTPLIISGAGSKSASLYRDFARAVRGLIPDEDFEMDEAKHTIMATDEGLKKIENRLGIEIYGDLAGQMVNHLQQALKAEYMFHRDQQYVVTNGEVKIVDEFTGRIMEGRRYSEGLHQAIEAKENVKVLEENQTLATITLQNYFRLYDKLSGMTGTAMTEDGEFREIYHLPVQEIPSNRPVIREDHDDQVYRTIEHKFNAVADDIQRRHEKGQPVLVGTVTIENSERLSGLLDKRGIEHEVLNAKFHEREAQIVAQAGREGAVTIATNMAGRGTDILLGGNPEVLAEDILVDKGIELDVATDAERDEALAEAKSICATEREHVVDAGGLCVIGTERHESRRIDNQLRGRSGRQGDPGETQFYLSLEDDLMRLFGGDRMDRIGTMMQRYDMPDDMPLQAKMVTKAVEGAQRKIEEINFGMRKNVLDYDDVMNEQRKVVYAERNRILDGEDLVGHLQEVLDQVVDNAISEFCSSSTSDEWDLEGLSKWLEELTGKKDLPILDSEMGRKQVTKVVHDYIEGLYEQRAESLGEEAMADLSQQIMLRVIDQRWMTYLQEMDYLKTGIGLRGFGQRDPLVEYKQEAFRAFQQFVAVMYEDFLRTLLRIEISRRPAPQPEPDPLAHATFSGPAEVDGDQGNQQRRGRIAATSNIARNGEDSKPPVRKPYVKAESGDPYAGVGRNDLCPCGSGKKFKNCHGKRG
ncbi:preprotein translocase subunit SecA [Olsenella sp. KGMB02461]|nr:preprotein translocase subunit SecA [Olsenella sp. KGMB02461]